MFSGDAASRRPGSPGFTLPVMLIVVALTGLGASKAEISARYRADRDREAELFFRGGEFVRAIRRFYMAEPDPAKRRLPRSLDELEKDPRAAHVRHIRRVYADPLTGGEFRLLMTSGASGSGLAGVASASDRPLLRRVDFGPELPFSAAAARASDLRFEVDLKALAGENAKEAARAPKGAAVKK